MQHSLIKDLNQLKQQIDVIYNDNSKQISIVQVKMDCMYLKTKTEQLCMNISDNTIYLNDSFKNSILIPISDITVLEIEEESDDENVIAMMKVEEQEIYFVLEEGDRGKISNNKNNIICNLSISVQI